MAMIRAFMSHGHLEADLDPLELDKVYADIGLGSNYSRPGAEMRKLVDHEFYGFTDADLDRSFYVDLP